MLARHREALVAAAAAASTAVLLAWLAPAGGDMAAHAYQRALFLRHGLTLWDNYWYAGRYVFVGYSVLYYPLAAALGIRLLAVLTVAVSAAAFAVLLEREWGAATRWASRSFAVLWAGVLLTGEFPFALGVALALLALVALQGGRRWTGAVLIVLVLAASPVAFVLLAVVLAGTVLSGRAALRGNVAPAAALVLGAVAELIVMRLFPAGETLGFAWGEALEAIAFCLGGIALMWGVERGRLLRGFLTVYLVAVLASWAIPSGLGHDVTRVRFLALPLVLLLASLRRWRPVPVVLAAVALATVWNVAPLAAQWVRSDGDRTRHAEVWDSTLRYLHAHLRPGYRVEAVDTSQHWPAYYLANAGIPLVRGWFRQDDFPTNALLYGSFTAAEYRSWLRSLGVAYVVLADAPADASSRAEAGLARSGRSGLEPVAFSRYVTVYAVPHPRSIVSGPGQPRVVAFQQASLAVRVARAGTYRIAVHWSRWWHASTGRLSRTTDGMIELRSTGAATVRLSFEFP